MVDSLNIRGLDRSLDPALFIALTVTADAPQEGTVSVLLVCEPETFF